MLNVQRGLHTTVRLSARTKYTKPKPKPQARVIKSEPSQVTHHDNNLKIRAPIPPSAKNIVCPEDHPLWQFFADKKFLRDRADLDNHSRPWTIPELRRKSFEDLHSLWYTSLKERNILARENHLLKTAVESSDDSFEKVADKVRTTMWRIRHVLSERDWSYRIANEAFVEEVDSFVQEFEKDFLLLSQDEDEEAFEQLSRFQKSIFGISEFIDENVVNKRFIDGMKLIANLKVKKFSERNNDIKTFLDQTPNNKITDAGEAFLVFTCENTEKDVKEACEAVLELRNNGNAVSRYDELDTVAEYVNRLAQAQSQATQPVSEQSS
ncbi:hypothetical protein Kpol_1001p15 [Vanderwaltozyma polyspora DSM 70294]|uniref:Large ribosomal subunit protein uL29m n=1 Tax=Vanderwaltozyma polyspora (strain ATCC 22028 / DSM 70294 / BCRC 21397 / CBS 2163 / NBRC 10782 / NRRL Y-8283 / UCD 57-17) TaxID=436907 RepID=RM04_VANPO|nr:uncharacterized protein Kpol_1001p15 [Vanderwaltozyma polyspora DSM 70294]A7TNQ2.1 RecName: Full=Large ribosomal subunit protein uL29m; AltName: Full=54S ribosomal protein L4, mitochondrial; Flags: Precursor [Vanderwaltozyma polyspora DSM 70294]EDO16103.1 hypothetical protein Kpol_1001p15 [Vanderwaltozyma polyspora DSM 70294]